MTQINYYDRIRLRSMEDIDTPDEDELCIQIVPAYEADAASGRISAEAPVGRAALHRRIGETIDVRAQGRTISMRIMTVEKHLAAT